MSSITISGFSPLQVEIIEGFITPQQSVGEVIQLMGATGSDFQVTGTFAPQSRIVCHCMRSRRNDAIQTRDFFVACAGQFGTLSDDFGTSWTLLFIPPIVPRILTGNYGWKGTQYKYRVQCELTVEAQA